jgi:subtilase family serine protease
MSETWGATATDVFTWPQEGDSPCFEPLEPRLLLSSEPTASPLFKLYYPEGSVDPASSVSPIGLTPDQIRHAYGIDVTMFGSIVGDGTGQTIAIVDAYDDPNIVSDTQVFCNTFNLPTCNLILINQTGGSTLPTPAAKSSGGGWALEIALDVQWAHVVAPQATILLVEADSNSYTDLFAAVATAAAYPGVSAVSMSWGSSEFSTETTYDSYMTTPAGHTGVTFLTAAGDNGAYISRRTLGVDYPPASPNVIAVGGTLLSIDSNNNYISESGWGYGTSSYRNGGSGGGIAKYESQPAYQNGEVNDYSTTKRTVPDVAFNADPNSGVAVYDSWDSGSLPWFQVGGTSLSSPMWAGVIALVDQARTLYGMSSLTTSQALTQIYSLSAANFHDITTGNNGYAAGPGYDLVTGLGTPIVNLLAPAMAGIPTNSPPVLAGIEGTALAYTENAAATAITSSLAATDSDNTNLAGATIQITGNYQSGQDVLAFINTANITGSWNATTGALTLTGSDTVANYQAALRSVTYRNSSDNPSALTRTVSFTVNDGAANSNTATRNITIVVVNDPPVLAGIEATALAYTENNPATAITGTILASDIDNTSLASAAIQITGNYQNGQDVLAFTNANGITGAWNATTGVLTLSGSSSVTNYQAALRSVTYRNSSDNPSTLTRTISFTVNDGLANSNTATRNITIVVVNDPPVLAGIESATLAYTENDPATIITGTVAASDIDNTSLSGATIQITSNYQNGQDVLAFVNANGITGAWNATTGVLTLSGSSSVANYQAALQSITYQNSSDNPSTLTRTVSFTVNDGLANSNTATRNITIAAVNDPPVLAGIEVAALTYTENDPATIITGTVAASDIDNTSLSGATIQITGNYQNDQDVLAFVNTANITGSWNATTGALTLSGIDTLPNYQAALQSVTYSNTAEAPSPLTRTISFSVTDGTAESNLVTRDISITDTTTFWTGAADTHWENAANWTNGIVPGAAVKAILAGAPTLLEPVLFQNESVLGLEIRSAGWTVDLSGWTLSLNTGGLSLPGGGTPTSTIQLGSGNLIVAYGGASPLATVQGYLAAGGGTKIDGAHFDWNGAGGITSSAAAASNLYTSLGLRDNGYPILNRPAMTEIDGVPIPAQAIVIRYTWIGDMDLTGEVTVNDYLEFLDYFRNPPSTDEITWMTGDFNYDGAINVNDYLQLLGGYRNQTGPLSSGAGQALLAATSTAATAAAAASTAPNTLINQLKTAGGARVVTQDSTAPDITARKPRPELAIHSAASSTAIDRSAALTISDRPTNSRKAT